jgi:ABC-type Fe3+/spermidine/putrescine transport system ATPase subunit
VLWQNFIEGLRVTSSGGIGNRINPSASAGPLLEIRALAKRFAAREVLRNVSFEVGQGEFLTLLGESGSGKTTLLRLVAGFEQPDAGEIWMNGERLDQSPPYRRRVNTVFQSYALFPHLSVFENVAYGLRAGRAPKHEIPARVELVLSLVKMSEFIRSAPRTLSGGQQQRVALARALVNRPQILLLDEPLSALDAGLRRQMQVELKSLQREVGISFLFVTHDQEEAMALSDRIALLRAGELEQVATPREIYNSPATAYVAAFVGNTNLLRAEVRDRVAHLGVMAWSAGETEGSVTFSLRPECIRLASSSEPPANGTVRFQGTIRRQTFAGASDLLEVVCTDGRALLARIPARGALEGAAQFEFFVADAIPVQEDK